MLAGSILLSIVTAALLTLAGRPAPSVHSAPVWEPAGNVIGEGLSEADQEAFIQVEALLGVTVTEAGPESSAHRQTGDERRLELIVELAGASLEAARSQIADREQEQLGPESSRAAETRASTLSLLDELIELRGLSGERGPGSGDKFNRLSEQLAKRLLLLHDGNQAIQLPAIERLLVALVAIREDTNAANSDGDQHRGTEADSREPAQGEGEKPPDSERGWLAQWLDKIFG